ncbi:MAG: hypothetical protein RJA92_123 [Bacteroidota bacterium]
MQNISLHNYQDFLLRYIDGELDLRETEALLAFVALHPAIAEELESLQSTKLDIEAITCPNKSVLYKNIFPVTLEPETIVYPNKQKLFKKEKEKAPVVLLRWWAVGAAAIFIFIVARYGMFNGEGAGSLSNNNSSTNITQKNSVAKNSVAKNGIAPLNYKANKNITVANTGSLAATNATSNQQNIATNILEDASAQALTHPAIEIAYTVTASEASHSIPSYNGDIIDVKPTVIAEITVPSITGSLSSNDDTAENIETIDTEAASSNRSVMVCAFEIDKDKFRGLFRKVNAIIKNKENNKNEK